VKVLGIETSCDETAVAVVEDGREVLSNVISSQVDLHARFGGVVPEVAARAHVEALNPILERSLSDAGVDFADLDGVAVTIGPGLVGALQFTKPGTTEPEPELAWQMVLKAIQRGVMLFAPVGVGGCAVKINPPLIIDEEALNEGLDVLEEIAAEL